MTSDKNKENASQKVVPLFKGRPLNRRSDRSPFGARRKSKTRVMAITSGKGGVGKTNIVANLGFCLSQQGKKVLIMDADLGLGNLDVLLGLAPQYDLSHVILGLKPLSEVMVPGPGNMTILPASSGIQELTRLSRDQKIQILMELDRMADDVDILLIDTAAGISSNVTYFNTVAQDVVVIVTPEPTSITDAYALMKLLSLRYSENQFRLVVNLVSDGQQALEVYNQVRSVTDRFLDVRVDYMGYLHRDPNVPRCVLRQKIVTELYPESEITRQFHSLGKRLWGTLPSNPTSEDSHFFWDHVIDGELDER